MKKLLILLIAAVMTIPMGYAADKKDKQIQKAVKKERKEKMKEFKKGGWEVFGTARTLETALTNHYTQLDQMGENAFEVSGVATKCKSKNVGHQMAVSDACINYANSCGSSLEGRVLQEMTGTGDAEGEYENFFAAYERMVEKEIKGEMRESLSLIRTNPDGTYEIQSFFIVSEDAATKARMRAMENALKESTMAREHAERLSQFIKGNKK